MATDDDDILTGPVPFPDAEPTAAERAHARTFAELVDKTLSGRTPPAMSADDRALLEVATVIRATSGKLELTPAKRSSLIEDVLRQAVAGGAGASMNQGVTPIARGRARRLAPWIVAGASSLVAAAAVTVLWLRSPHLVGQPVAPPVAPTAAALPAVPASWTSRPTDPMIGPIPRERAGDAGARIDYIFADRLDGYRDRRMSRARGGTP